MLANKVPILEHKIKNLEIQNNNLDQSSCRNYIEISCIPEVVSGKNFENTVLNIFDPIHEYLCCDTNLVIKWSFLDFRLS